MITAIQSYYKEMYMNPVRIILDGLAMAAYFNLFAAAAALYNPRLMFPYDYQIVKRAADKGGKPFLSALDLLWRAAAAPDLRCDKRRGGRHDRILAACFSRIYSMDDGQFLRPDLFGFMADSEKSKEPICHSGHRRSPRI